MNHQINLLHLKYFCDAAIFNSISEAAKKNYITQSAVSQAITKLEVCLGVQIVIHTRQKFQMTEEGRILFEQSRYIFKAIQEVHDKINLNKAEIKGNLKFVSTNSLGMSFIAHAYKKMQVNLPHIQMSYSLGNLTWIRNALRQEEAEFAIVVYDSNFADFNKQVLKKGRFNFYQSIDASPHLLESGILIDHLKSLYVSDLINHFDALKTPLKIQTELASWEVVARFVELNIGIGFFPDYLMDHQRYPTLRIYPLDIPSYPYEICAIYNKGATLSRTALAFLEQF